MADITTKNQLKQWFVTGSKPLQAQYYAWMDAYWHKSEQISINSISGLSDVLSGKADVDQLANYALLDASNIAINQGAWRTALGINDITPPDVDLSNYYTKEQVDDLLDNVTVDLSAYATQNWVSTNYVSTSTLSTELAKKIDKTSFATQAEAESQTAPAAETGKPISTWSIWKFLQALTYIILKPNASAAIANRLRSNGSRLLYANNSAVESTVAYTSDLPTTFKFTPTGNFTTSQLKTAAENAGLIFNGLHFFINIGTNNFTCTVDNGSAFPETIITIGKRGTTGSIQFASSRTLNAGIDNITILNGNENSMALLNFGTSQDLLTVINQ